MATDTASRASMDHQGMRSEGAGADRARVKNALDEALRKTAGEGAVAFYAQKNPAINPAVSHLNIDMVNDGHGGFRTAASIAEVQGYIDQRRGRLTRELKADNRHLVTTVVHLPRAYTEPDGTQYQATDKNGKKKFYRDGSAVMVDRHRIRPDRYEEAMRYFDSYLAFHSKLMPGGQDAIAGYSINLDESRPHAQIFSDPFESDISKKHPHGLKNGYQRTFGTHRKDRKVAQLDRKTGQPVIDAKTGKPKMVAEGGARKMERYHRELKEYLLAEGFEIEAERDGLRHDRRVDLDDFKDLADDRQVVAADMGAAAEFEAGVAIEHEAALADAAGEAADMHQNAAAKLAEAEQAATAAAAAGYEAGRAEGLAEVEALREELATAVEDGRKQGYDAGHAQGEEAGRTAGREKARIEYELKEARLAEREAAVEQWDEVTEPALRAAIEDETRADREAAKADRDAAAEAVKRAREVEREMSDELEELKRVREFDGEAASQLMSNAKIVTMRRLAGRPGPNGEKRSVDEWIDDVVAGDYARMKRPVPTETFAERLAADAAKLADAERVINTKNEVVQHMAETEDQTYGLGD